MEFLNFESIFEFAERAMSFALWCFLVTVSVTYLIKTGFIERVVHKLFAQTSPLSKQREIMKEMYDAEKMFWEAHGHGFVSEGDLPPEKKKILEQQRRFYYRMLEELYGR